MASAICSAVRVLVPLKAMCSRTWLMPCSASVSLREPALTQMPREALSRCGMSSVMTVMPVSRVVDRTLKLAPPGPGARTNEGFDGILVVGKHVEALLPFEKIRQPCRQSRFNSRGGLYGGRKLGGMRRGESDHGCGAEFKSAGNGDGNSSVRVEQVACLGLDGGDGCRGFR